MFRKKPEIEKRKLQANEMIGRQRFDFIVIGGKSPNQ
jgi:hypothetical protein